MDSQSTKEVLSSAGIAVAVIAVILCAYAWSRRRENRALKKWAAENGLEILHCEERYLFGTGPFKWWSILAKQAVYFLTVRDEQGQERRGWIRLGRSWGMIYSGDTITEARWKEPDEASGH